ncbi:MAG: IS21 family transposase [Bacteroidales bacterium]|jgi:transposase/predicted transcriptional regulator|nr:IS21 family transposase [Bacteroidales bacterium]
MANTLDPMDLKQIITLSQDGLSNRQISELLDISRNTVNNYMKLFKACDYEFDELLHMHNQQLKELFTAHTTIKNDRFEQLMLYFDKVNKGRNHPGFTFQFHYNEYKEEVTNPYSYTQFMEHYKRKYAKVKGSMKLEHEAGKEVYIDYAGKKLHIVDKETGELIPVEVFVALLPNSQYTYVEASMSQKREDMIESMGNTLSYFGGVPKAIVSDNLKSAVTRACKYEPDINRTFKDFARHYNCVINPTRSYSPQDKALVENAVQLAYQRIYYPMREMVFFSLEDLNREIKKLLHEYNNLLFQRKQASRKELFQSVERSYLKPLPTERYKIKDYKRAKVQKIGYVYFSPDKSYYSVPYRYIGKTTLIHYTKSTVEVYCYHERIAFHKRNPSMGIYNTNKDHLSSTHKAYTDWSPDYFKKMASKHGNDVITIIDKIMTQCDYPETAYKRAMGIIQLHRTYGSERLNNACKRALYVGTNSYKHISNMLKNNKDKEPLLEEQITIPHIPKHANIRGASNYN